MMHGLLWVFGVYALSAAAAHLFWAKMSRRTDSFHFILICENNERQIEWVIRSILFYAWLGGKNLHITLIDLGSTDDTLRIAQTIFRRHIADGRWHIMFAEKEWQACLPAETDETNKVIFLNEIEDWRNIPLAQ